MVNTYLIALVIWASLVVLPSLAVWWAFNLDDPGFWAAYIAWFTIAGGLTGTAYVLHQRESRKRQ